MRSGGGKSVGEWLDEATHRIGSADLQCADPRRHAHQILEAVLGWSMAKILARTEEELGSDALGHLEAFLSRRLGGEPFQYILGRESFWKDEFSVGPGVLIPRRETEHVVEFLASLPLTHARVVELGAGSGNIGISTLREKPQWIWFAAEKSAQAFEFARRNSLRLLDARASVLVEPLEKSKASDLGGTYTLYHGDFFALAPAQGPWDVVVSNPPYVATAEIPTLAKEVRREPALALDGGADGLDFVRRIAQVSQDLLKPGGWLVLEIGSDQRGGGLEILSSLGYEQVNVLADLAGLARVLIGKK